MSAPKVQVSGKFLQGLSAYEVAVKNGFEGTEKEWLASLKGGGEIQEAVNQYFEENPITAESLGAASENYVQTEIAKYLTIDSEVLV